MKQIRNTITKAEIAQMPKVFFEGRIFVVYTEEDAEKAAKVLIEKGVRRVFISMGAKGVFAATAKESVWHGIIPGNMVNTTGCGDAFMGALVWAYLEGMGLRETAAAGLAAGSIAMESDETINPLMSPDLLKNRMKRK